MFKVFLKSALTYSDLVTATPFENTVDSFDLSGKVLREVLEHSVSASWDDDKFNGKYMIQIAGKHDQPFRNE